MEDLELIVVRGDIGLIQLHIATHAHAHAFVSRQRAKFVDFCRSLHGGGGAGRRRGSSTKGRGLCFGLALLLSAEISTVRGRVKTREYGIRSYRIGAGLRSTVLCSRRYSGAAFTVTGLEIKTKIVDLSAYL